MSETHDARDFVLSLSEVVSFLGEGELLEEIVQRVPSEDIARFGEEYPSLFPPEISENPAESQVYAATFIRSKKEPSDSGHAKLKVYVDMLDKQVLKIFQTG